MLPSEGKVREEPAACRECWERERRDCEVHRMKPTDDRKITDTLLHCARGETFADCTQGCAYAVRGRECQYALMRDAANANKHMRLTVDTLTEKVKTLQDENAALREKLAKCEEDENKCPVEAITKSANKRA